MKNLFNSERREQLIRFIRGEKDCEQKFLAFRNAKDSWEATPKPERLYRDGVNDREYLQTDGRWISQAELLDTFGDCRDHVTLLHIYRRPLNSHEITTHEYSGALVRK